MRLNLLQNFHILSVFSFIVLSIGPLTTEYATILCSFIKKKQVQK